MNQPNRAGNRLLAGAMGFINGLFGGGGGMVGVPLLQKLGLPRHKSHATALLLILPLSAFSALFYLFGGAVDWRALLFVTIGQSVGAVGGALLLGRLPDKPLRIGFGIVMLIAGGRMLLF